MRPRNSIEQRTCLWRVLLAGGLVILLGYPSLPATISGRPRPWSWEFWNRLIIRKPPVPRRPGTSRGEICLIAPVSLNQPGETVKLWSRTPQFLWRGKVGKFELQLEDNTVIWTGVPVPSDRDLKTLTYDGQPLQPGQNYRLIVFGSDLQPRYRLRLQGVPEHTHATLTQALQSLEQQASERKLSASKTTLAQINYFADQQLWTDALQVAFTKKPVSQEIRRYRVSVKEALCDGR